MQWTKTANLISCILLAVTLVVWLLSHAAATNPAFASIGSYHLEAINGWICVWHGGTGPFSGGGIVHGPAGVEIKSVVTSVHFMNVYFARFWRPAPYASNWTCMIPLYYLLAIAAAFPAFTVVKGWVDQRNHPSRGFPVS